MSVDKSTKKFILSLIMVILAGGVCFTACAAYIFAWFSSGPARSNVDVDITEEINLDVSLSTDGQNWSSELDEIIFEDIFCGYANRKTLFVRCINNDINDLLLSFFFVPPDGISGEETPYVDGSRYNYLGSQLQISDIRIALNGQSIDASGYAVGKNRYLVTTSSQGLTKGQVNYVGAAVTEIPRLDILSGMTLPVGASVMIEIDFTFVDNGTDQNIYQNSDDFVCSRRLMLR